MAADTKQKIRDHDLVLTMYRRAMQYADLLDAAGNSFVADEVRGELATVSREHVIDRILKEDV